MDLFNTNGSYKVSAMYLHAILCMRTAPIPTNLRQLCSPPQNIEALLHVCLRGEGSFSLSLSLLEALGEGYVGI